MDARFAVLLGSLVLFGAALWRLRAVAADAERQVWLWLFAGVAVLGGAGAVAAGLGLVSTVLPGGSVFGPGIATARWPGTGAPVLAAAGLIACLCFYQGLVRWHRSRTLLCDPADWLNGVSAVLVLAAFLDLLVQTPAGQALLIPALRADTLAAESHEHLGLAAMAAGVVLLGSLATVAVIARLVGDVRLWLLGGAFLLIQAAAVVLVLDTPVNPIVGQLLWLGAGCAVLLTGVIRRVPGEPEAATNQSAMVGALLVLVTGVAVLALNTGLIVPIDHSVTAYAALGVIGVGIRILRMVQDLAHLARTRLEAMTDELTGIGNRRALMAALQRELRVGPATLLVIDLDQFKIINDRYGHAAGDTVLRQAAAGFAARVPPGAVLARLGGDEFAVLLPGLSMSVDEVEAIEALAHSLTEPLAGTKDAHGRTLSVGGSVGAAGMPVGSDGGELLRRADTAMYRAKTSGLGFCPYDSKVDALAQERQELKQDLCSALAGSGAEWPPQIIVHFQPQLDVDTGEVVGAEALVRWRHPRLGLLKPEAFIALAEESGLMTRLTTRVMGEAVRQVARCQERGYDLRMAVNLSASVLGHPETLAAVSAAVGSGIRPERLVLEVTETSLMVDPGQALVALRRIAESGVGVSIDDYGTGYSSLSYLNDLPATEVKIDRSFIARMSRDPRTAAIVTATVELAHRLGLRIVAEGVEDVATLIMLKRLGCDESQGYLHAEPLDGDQFLAYLAARTPLQQVPAQIARQSSSSLLRSDNTA